jgi:Asp-tRNA(Asn)/Glu-tRNA(Gln) amidotransferase A subunit family amidase
MASLPAPVHDLRQRYACGETDPAAEIELALAKANSNAGHNVYLAQDAAWTHAEASALRPEAREAQPLWGIPVSLKDCFDLTGFPTSCGSKFYREKDGLAAQDSAVAAKLRAAGAVITGKTHLHQLAYGITGENRDFGDCLQPRDAALLTGGSSSGAAASVQEGSALAAIGTDTGGSIRLPAAICGLAGFRASIATGARLWRGGAHLAPSFDTLGWLYRDLRDGPLLAQALFGLPPAPPPVFATLRIAVPHESFFHDCDPDVIETLTLWLERLQQERSTVVRFDAGFWDDAFNLFAPIQAAEAAMIHRGNFEHFETAIAERLAWGASIPTGELAGLRLQLDTFRRETARRFGDFDFLLMPCTPVSALAAGEDQSQARAHILRYTSPVSLAGMPAVTLPPLLPGQTVGTQLCGPVGSDAALLALSVHLGCVDIVSN